MTHTEVLALINELTEYIPVEGHAGMAIREQRMKKAAQALNSTMDEIKAVRNAALEECAKLCEGLTAKIGMTFGDKLLDARADGCKNGLTNAAAAIRAAKAPK